MVGFGWFTVPILVGPPRARSPRIVPMKRLMATAAVLFCVNSFGQNLHLGLRPVATELDMPVGIANAGDSRLFFVLQRGRISIDGRTLFLDLSSIVSCCDERGLLGLAFDSHYAQNGLFFVCYTALNGDVTVARYRV